MKRAQRMFRGRARLVMSACLSAAVIFAVLISPAQAIDCRKAANALDHMICADASLRQADAAMGQAYRALLQSTADAEIKAMLVASQKRWLAARDERLGHLDEAPDAPDDETRGQILRDAMRQRTEDLARRAAHDASLPYLVEVALGQRRFAAPFTGGRFAGFETSCDFLPQAGHYAYGCFATHRYQNGTRVCSVRQDWASGSVSETRSVGRVVGDGLRTVATCAIGGGDGDGVCPGSTGPGEAPGRWRRHADTEAITPPPAQPYPKLDAEIGPDTDEPWLHACLTDANYPPSMP